MKTPINYKKYAEYDLSILSEKSRNVLQDKINGLYGWEIQEKYGLTCQQLAHTLSNARRKLEGLDKKYYEEHKKSILERQKANPNRQAIRRKYYEKQKEENPNFGKEQYQKFKDYQKEYNRKRYAENKEWYKEKNRLYHEQRKKENVKPKIVKSPEEKKEKQKQYMHDYYLRVLKNKRKSERILTVKEFRQSTGLSQNKFAEHFGIPVRTLQEWEQDRQNPPPYLLDLLKRIWKAETTSQ